VKQSIERVCWLVSSPPVAVLEPVVAVGYVDCW